MRHFLWKIERGVILSARNPRQYAVTLSALGSGVVGSLEISESLAGAIDRIPYVVYSDWLNYVLFLVLFLGLFRILPLIFLPFSNREPFEAIARYVDTSDVTPNLTRHFQKRLKEGPVERISSPLEYRMRSVGHRELDNLCQINREIF